MRERGEAHGEVGSVPHPFAETTSGGAASRGSDAGPRLPCEAPEGASLGRPCPPGRARPIDGEDVPHKTGTSDSRGDPDGPCTRTSQADRGRTRDNGNGRSPDRESRTRGSGETRARWGPQRPGERAKRANQGSERPVVGRVVGARIADAFLQAPAGLLQQALEVLSDHLVQGGLLGLAAAVPARQWPFG